MISEPQVARYYPVAMATRLERDMSITTPLALFLEVDEGRTVSPSPSVVATIRSGISSGDAK